MVLVDTHETARPAIPPANQTAPNGSSNGHSHPPTNKAKGPYSRASDFLSNTSNWKVSRGAGFHDIPEARVWDTGF
jgi:hypothetical protein